MKIFVPFPVVLFIGFNFLFFTRRAVLETSAVDGCLLLLPSCVHPVRDSLSPRIDTCFLLHADTVSWCSLVERK